jgi:signal transduction histidine kinase
MLKTLKSKFILFTTIFIIISVGIPTYFLLHQLHENFRQRSRFMLETTLQVVDQGLYLIMMLGEKKNVQEIIEQIALNRGIDHIRLVDASGMVQYSSIPEEIGAELKSVSPSHQLPDPNISGKLSLYEKEHIYSFIEPIINRPECQSCHNNGRIISYLDVDIDLTDAERTFQTSSDYVIFLAVLIVLILVLGFFYLFNVFINKPLNRIINALTEVEQGNLHARLPARKEDEIGIVENHFNKMVNRIRISQEHIEELHFEELRRADKLVTLGELAAEMAHEINNPACIILSRTNYLQMIPELHPQQNDLAVISEQVEKISRITKNILKYSKRPPKKFQKIDLAAIIDNCINLLQPRISKKKIALIKKMKMKNSQITGDALQLEQAFINLINNAIDALSPEGTLEITLKRNATDHTEVRIQDNGTGMDAHIQEQIFSPFFTTKSMEKGTGLGLYIVKNICKNHNAEISCESVPNKGSTFIITFGEE